MAKKDRHEDLLKYYEFMLGKLPNRDTFKKALEETVRDEDLKIFFLLPFLGQLTPEKLEKKAQRTGISKKELELAVTRLIPEGLITTYHKDGVKVFERGSILTMTELQIRKMEELGHGEASIRLEAARFMDLMIEGGAANVPTKTPYYRVLPVQSAITGQQVTGEVVMDAEIPDPRAVLPIDEVTEMIKKQPLMVVAECYCRKAKQILGKGCEHPLDTCFYFNELAELQLNAGRARKISFDEAVKILKDCEEQGLVHNVNNAQGHIHSLCNCCACSCGVIKSIQRGETNAGAPSRFIVSHDEAACVQCGICAEYCPSHALTFHTRLSLDMAKCIGCGLCVSHCPENAMRMVPREEAVRIPETVDDMFSRINREAIIGMVVGKFKRK
jgi:Pyruvate/2-oxoacid:ferredoxin oxidoreductase delta subunit